LALVVALASSTLAASSEATPIQKNSAYVFTPTEAHGSKSVDLVNASTSK
jgi:hypothetical protein